MIGRIALASLALAAGSLVAACGRTKEPPVAAGRLADSADQTLFGAHQLMTDRGLLKADLRSDTAYFFDDNTRIELRKVALIFFTATGVKNGTLASREGTYNTSTQIMQARGDVVVVSEDGRRLTTSELRFNQGANEIASDSAFVLTEPTRRLEGVGFRSDPQMKNVRVLRTISGNAGPTVIPGQ